MAATRHRATRQGGAVRDALCAAGGFRSAQDVYATLRTQGESVGLSTVYRHLQSFADSDLVDVIHTPEGETTYRYCGEPGRGHHHHLVCRDCGRAEEIEGRAIERWAATVAERYGYTEVDHTVELFGRCAACSTVGAIGEALVGPLATGTEDPDTVPTLIEFAARAPGAADATT